MHISNMEVQLIIELIEQHNWGPYKLYGQKIMLSCPFKAQHEKGTDDHFSFLISSENGGRYFCFACKRHGSVVQLFEGQIYPTQLLWPRSSSIKKEDIEFPIKYLNKFKQNYNHPYLDKRDISFPIRKIFDFRYDMYNHRIGVPIYNFNYKLCGFIGRSLISEPRYYFYKFNGQDNPQVWLGEHFIDLNKPVILCEGLFDACKIYEVNPNVLALLGTQPTEEKLKRIKRAQYIITLFDNDHAGDNIRKKLTYVFKKKIHHISLPEGVKDPGELNKEQLERLFKKQVLL